MKYEQIKKLKAEKFRRLTGVKIATLDKMIIILRYSEIKKNMQ